jgi:hypothetical protein
VCASTARKKYGLFPRRLLVSRTQLDAPEESGYLDPDRRGDRADEAEAIVTFLMDGHRLPLDTHANYEFSNAWRRRTRPRSSLSAGQDHDRH